MCFFQEGSLVLLSLVICTRDGDVGVVSGGKGRLSCRDKATELCGPPDLRVGRVPVCAMNCRWWNHLASAEPGGGHIVGDSHSEGQNEQLQDPKGVELS